ncbi:MAG TPA: acyltransferase [Ilumatobacteraceae bacterium]|nr:acyltransferase [Ilumatobacteraceae bacterium]HRB03120.1 acyltransferase [Ilumatobacteraceae bacterium]
MAIGDTVQLGSHGHPDPRTLPHRPMLDGLRGVAVALVVIYHFRPSLLGGGFIGVDVFFVLSGFLIGSLLLSEAEHNGRVDLRRFVVRRVRRLAPAMLLLVLAMALYAVTWANAFEVHRLRVHGLWALLSLANWKFIAEGVTYTDVIAGVSPLRHVWSLSIEEQFYVALPVGVWLLARVVTVGLRRTALIIAAVLAAVSVASTAFLSFHGASVSRTYFGTDTRAQALLVGVALGAALVGRPVAVAHRRVAGLGATVGGAVLLTMAFVADERSTMMARGGFLVVALAAALLIAGAEHAPGVRQLLSMRGLLGLGAISYGVYLWHWPILVVFDASRTGLANGSVALFATRLALTFAAALLSYWLVERPIRRGALRRRLGRVGALMSWAAATATVVAVLIVATAPPSVSGDRGAEPVPPASTVIANTGTSPSTVIANTGTSLPTGQPVHLVMFGDSVAHSLAGGEVLTFPNVAPWKPEQATVPDMVSVARPGCSFLPGLVTVDGVQGGDLSNFCGDWRHDLADAIDSTHATQVACLLVNDMSDRLVDGALIRFGSPESTTMLDALFDEIRSIATEHGAELVLLAPAPRAAEFAPEEGDRTGLMLAAMQQYGTAHGLQVVSLADAPTTKRFDGEHYAWKQAHQVMVWLVEQLRS